MGSELERKVIETIAKQFNRSPEEIRLEDEMTRAYGAKSHDMMLLSAAVQATFGIKITYIQSRNAKTVGGWVKLIGSLSNKDKG